MSIPDGSVTIDTRSSPQPRLKYALVTPAHNEADYIEGTIRAVIEQTLLPCRWVIVSDGSTDETDIIARRFAEEHQWIEVVRVPERAERHFAGKADAFNLGWERVAELNPDIVGNVDADITFDSDYFDFLISRFEKDQSLGVAGTILVEGSGAAYDYRFASETHVSGACQLFRRPCLEDIGGYLPIRRGAIDWVAVTTARMKGWRTRAFMEKHFIHHRPMGTGGGGVLAARFKQGVKDYYVGGHPVWQLLRCLYHLKSRPVFVGGLFMWMGYCWALLRRMEAPLPPGLRAFHRSEQLTRLRDLLRSLIR